MQIDQYKIVVTGAASGMGRHFALSLARAGASVAALDVNTEALAALAAEAEGAAGTLKTWLCNVADEASVGTVFGEAWAAFGGLNGLVNNAGIIRDGLLVKKDRETGAVTRFPLSKWQQVIDVNLTGPFLCTRELAARMIEAEAGPGAIVNISSISRAGNMGQSNYSAAKAGLVADTVLWAGELARYGLRVGAIAPGFVDTPILEGMRPDALEKMLKNVPLRRLVSQDEIFMAVRFILENDAFTGRVVEVDAGLRL